MPDNRFPLPMLVDPKVNADPKSNAAMQMLFGMWGQQAAAQQPQGVNPNQVPGQSFVQPQRPWWQDQPNADSANVGGGIRG